MGSVSEEVRFLDDLDLTLSLDNRQSAFHQVLSIELAVQPIVFRASYRDIMLITAIFDRAYELYSMHNGQSTPPLEDAKISRPASLKRHPSDYTGETRSQGPSTPLPPMPSRGRFSENSHLLISKEHVRGFPSSASLFF